MIFKRIQTEICELFFGAWNGPDYRPSPEKFLRWGSFVDVSCDLEHSFSTVKFLSLSSYSKICTCFHKDPLECERLVWLTKRARSRGHTNRMSANVCHREMIILDLHNYSFQKWSENFSNHSPAIQTCLRASPSPRTLGI